ncbi:methyltransferase family protein [Salana multivorans]|uniref:Methyltransferase family protein n=1 Tax=Salana multivorans TaxID=120377 RepID=A0A3N2DE26_9MICO|nr:class I SAM-dependent methyltransferase [Salana multivorans]ROR97684.1 methyltransferase family protein [Salana multivorans]
MGPPEQAAIDARILAYYGEQFDEDARLTTRSAQGPLERDRTQDLIRRHVAGGRILDVGGGTGRHAAALVAAGYDVELVDPVPRHVDAARRAGIAASLGDARDLARPDGAVDAVLLLGPLYHLARREDRLRALREARRVTRPGGVVVAAALSRLVAFAAVSLGRPTPVPFPEAWVRLLADGTPPEDLRFPAGHFHTEADLRLEVEDAGLAVREVVGVEGPAGLFLETIADADPRLADAAATLAEAAATTPGILELSAHLLAVAVVP